MALDGHTLPVCSAVQGRLGSTTTWPPSLANGPIEELVHQHVNTLQSTTWMIDFGSTKPIRGTLFYLTSACFSSSPETLHGAGAKNPSASYGTRRPSFLVSSQFARLAVGELYTAGPCPWTKPTFASKRPPARLLQRLGEAVKRHKQKGQMACEIP